MPDCLLTSKERLMCSHSSLHSDSSSVVDGGGGACLCLCVCVHSCVCACVCVHHVTNGTDSVSPHSRWGKGGFFLFKKLFFSISYIYMKCDIIVSPPLSTLRSSPSTSTLSSSQTLILPTIFGAPLHLIRVACMSLGGGYLLEQGQLTGVYTTEKVDPPLSQQLDKLPWEGVAS